MFLLDIFSVQETIPCVDRYIVSYA
jgi:hypothetical protein